MFSGFELLSTTATIGILSFGYLTGDFSIRYSFMALTLFFVVGLCGGLTTFSTFTFENLMFLQNGKILYFFVYSLSSFVLCLIFTYTGYKLFQMLS